MHLRDVQQALTDLGYDPGPADGKNGPKTKAAVAAFQREERLSADGVPGPKTQEALTAALELHGRTSGTPAPDPLPPIIAHAKSLGHEVWGDPWRLWLFGIRSPGRVADRFDDAMGAAYVDGAGLWTVELWPATTDPGKEHLVEPMNSRGTAILKEGQYLDAWAVGLHRGKYEALRQVRDVWVYRDSTGDNRLDLDRHSVQRGTFGINLHASTQREGGRSTRVGRWSAGCQVHATDAGFDRMMELANMQIARIGRDTFSYTLMDRWW